MEKSRLNSILRNSIVIIGFISMLFILLDLILIDKSVDYANKANCIVNNGGILLILILATLIYLLVIKKRIDNYFKRFKNFIVKYEKVILFFLMILLFAFQVAISWNIYFYTGWDTRRITGVALSIVNGQIPADITYYSFYPNNLMLTAIFVCILKIAQFINMADPYFALILIGNLLINLSGVFLVLSVRKLIHNRKIIFLSWIIYVFLIGLSPWLVIPYSDSYGMIFPILTVFIYIHIKEGRRYLYQWFLLGLVCFLGYKIKPTIIIVLMAIVIIELLNLLSYNKEKIINLLLKIMMIFLAVILITCFSALPKSIVNIPIDKEHSLTYVHYLMMGLNEKGTGGFYSKDVNFSKSKLNKEEREKAQFEVIKKRLKKFGVVGYANFISKKILVNYNDGTFAWGVEGGFYSRMIEPKNDTISPFLRDIYYNEGKYYTIFRFITQSVWILVLVLYLGSIFSLKNERTNAEDVITLSIVGITLFLLLFEARARYLYCYSPIFVLGAMIGLHNVVIFFDKLKQNKILYQSRKVSVKS